MSFPILLIFFSILLIWLCHAFLRFYNDLRRRTLLGQQIYGPPTHPLLGNLPMFPKCRYKWPEFLISQSNLALADGHSLIRWWAGAKLAIWTLDAETSRTLLEHTTELKKGRDYEFFEQWLGKGLLLSDGQKWREQRKALTPTFHFSMLDQYSTVFNRQAKILVIRLSLMEGQNQQDIGPLLTRCSLDVIGETTMGIRLDSQLDGSPDYVEAVHKFNFLAHVFSTNILYWIPLFWILSGWARQTRKFVKVLQEFSKKVIDRRKRARKNGKAEENGAINTSKKGKTFLDLLLELEQQGKLDGKEVREQTDTFLFAGHDTTANALCWTIWCLACHPECQQRARNEVLDVLGPEEDEIDANQANQLRYLDRCLRESLRLFPPVPILERDLQEDLWIRDKLIPKGTMVVVSPMILHHREKVYPRHWEFDPDNFLPERQASRSSFDFVPFSAGPRNCIGQKFAMLELKIILGYILRRFLLSSDVPFLANRPGLEAILRPEFGVPVRIRPVK